MSDTGQKWLKVLEPGALPNNDVRRVVCNQRSLCLVRAEGRLAALDDACPHQGAPLSDGWVEEGLLICPRHAWAFDPFTGTLCGGLNPEIATYPVQEREDGVYVALPAEKSPEESPGKSPEESPEESPGKSP